jgi:hypothetical protein
MAFSLVGFDDDDADDASPGTNSHRTWRKQSMKMSTMILQAALQPPFLIGQ